MKFLVGFCQHLDKVTENSFLFFKFSFCTNVEKLKKYLILCFVVAGTGKVTMKCLVGLITKILIRDHPYITSAYFWTFSDPPTISA